MKKWSSYVIWKTWIELFRTDDIPKGWLAVFKKVKK